MRVNHTFESMVFLVLALVFVVPNDRLRVYCPVMLRRDRRLLKKIVSWSYWLMTHTRYVVRVDDHREYRYRCFGLFLWFHGKMLLVEQAALLPLQHPDPSVVAYYDEQY